MTVRLLLAPYDSGHRDWRMGNGPARLADAIAPALRNAGHAVESESIDLPDDRFATEVKAAFVLSARIAERVAAAREAGALPIVLAGNCGTAVGTVAGMDVEPAVIWFDAHGDLHTPETTESGFVDGMALSVLTGRCWRTMARSVPGFRTVADRRVCLVGARDLESAERHLLALAAIAHVVADGVDADLPRFVQSVAGEAYLHVDLDVLDPGAGRANGYAVPGGLSVAAMERAIHGIRQRLHVGAAAFTAYDPSCDPEGRIARAAAALACAVAGDG